MPKSPDAFRTISEVAEWLGVQAHVLRFWESKFAQVKPIKRAGGRRYYRPNDMLLLGGLKKVLHEDGLTIKGAQKLLREKGVAYVADMSQPFDDLTAAVIEGSAVDVTPEPASENVVAETPPLQEKADNAPVDELVADAANETTPPDVSETAPQTSDTDTAPAPLPLEGAMQDREAAVQAATEDSDAQDDAAEREDAAEMPSFRARPRPVPIEPEVPSPNPEDDQLSWLDAEESSAADEGAIGEKPIDQPEPALDAAPVDKASEPTTEETEDAVARKPRVIDVTPVPPYGEIEVEPAALAALAHLRRVTPEQAHQIKPLLARLTRLHASMMRHGKDG